MQKFTLWECVFTSNKQQDSFHYLYKDQFCQKRQILRVCLIHITCSLFKDHKENYVAFVKRFELITKWNISDIFLELMLNNCKKNSSNLKYSTDKIITTMKYLLRMQFISAFFAMALNIMKIKNLLALRTKLAIKTKNNQLEHHI